MLFHPYLLSFDPSLLFTATLYKPVSFDAWQTGLQVQTGLLVSFPSWESLRVHHSVKTCARHLPSRWETAAPCSAEAELEGV